MRRFLQVIIASLVVFCLAATPATATPRHVESRLLGHLWNYLLETPKSDNPFTGGDPCVRLGHVLIPFAPLGTTALSCDARKGTNIFVTAVTFECSTVEPPPFNGTTEGGLRNCAKENLKTYTQVSLTLDGKPVPLTRVKTRLLRIDLPADNILDTTEPTTRSVGAGQVALLRNLRPGTHILRIYATGPKATTVDNTTTITIRRRR